MRKLKMFYIKLAFAALFFILIVVSFAHPQGVGIATADALTINMAPIPTIVNISQEPARMEGPTRLISVKNKLYQYNLVIPHIKVNVGVLGMGVATDGRMAVPNNYTEVGWYDLGYRPGEIGSTVMGAHVDNGGKINGVFKNLKTLVLGDKIYINDGDGNRYEYTIIEKKVFDYRTAITTEVFSQNDMSRLNLITCYGTWLPKENTYNQRLVIFAELVKKN